MEVGNLMADEKEDPFFQSEEFLSTLWECGNCKIKFTGHSIRQHVWECPKGDVIKFEKLKGL